MSTKKERLERFNDYTKRDSRELAGMLIDIEESNEKLRKTIAQLRRTIVKQMRATASGS